MGDDKISASKPKIEEAIKKKEKQPNKGPQKRDWVGLRDDGIKKNLKSKNGGKAHPRGY